MAIEVTKITGEKVLHPDAVSTEGICGELHLRNEHNAEVGFYDSGMWESHRTISAPSE